MRLVLAALCWLCLLGAVSGEQTSESGSIGPADTLAVDRQIQENEARLEQTRKELARVHDELEKLGGQEKTVLAKVSSYEQEIALTRRYLRELATQIRARTREVAELAGEAERLAAEMRTRQEVLGRRLVAIYKYGRTLPLEAMLSRRTLPEVYRRMTYLRWFARNDEQLARELVRLGEEYQERQARVAAARENLAQLADEQQQHEAGLEKARAGAAALLSQVRSRQSDQRRLASELEEAARGVQALLAELERKRSEVRRPEGAHYLEQNKGRLSWPLAGQVVTNFGAKVHPRYGTRTTSLGIGIAPESKTDRDGAGVRAIGAGRVVYADQFMGYGNLIIVDHDGGYFTLYANLTEMVLKVGDAVEAGTQVGRVEDYLHFEIRREGKPIDPVPWLARPSSSRARQPGR